MARQSLTLPEVAEKLGIHYMTAYRYVRTGRLPARRVGSVWRIELSDIDKVRSGESVTGRRRTTGIVPARSQLESRLLASDEPGAWDVLETALGSGMEPEAVMLELVAPVLRSIGALWEQGELSIADEHRASAVASRLISRVGARFGRRGHKRGTVLLAAPSGEMHSAPVAIASNLLRWKGFRVIELGADTPADAIAQTAAQERGLVAVGLACTTKASLRSARRTVALLREKVPDVSIVVGGAALDDGVQAARIGADFTTNQRADELVTTIEAILEKR